MAFICIDVVQRGLFQIVITIIIIIVITIIIIIVITIIIIIMNIWTNDINLVKKEFGWSIYTQGFK